MMIDTHAHTHPQTDRQTDRHARTHAHTHTHIVEHSHSGLEVFYFEWPLVRIIGR